MPPRSSPDPAEIKSQAQKDLLALLEGVRGKKNIVLEKTLAGPIGLLVKFSTLQDYGVDKVFLLENGNVDSTQKNVVFIARGEDLESVQAIADQITRLQQNATAEHEFSIFWVPRRTLVSEQILENEGVLGDANLAELPLYFIPLENDLLSLELDHSFDDLYLRKDPTCLFLAARALMLMQQRHGLFPRIIGKGDYAYRVAEFLMHMRSEVTAGEHSSNDVPGVMGLSPSSSIESLIIIDRGVDFATPLLTQLTYEGLIDEQVGIQYSQAEVDSSIVGSAPGQQSQSSSSSLSSSAKQGMKRKIQLDSSDQLYNRLRNANFAIVGSNLNKVARRLESDYESRHGAKSTAELREFVNKLPGYQAEQQSLKIHTGLAEEIMKYTKSDLFTRVLEVQQSLVAGADPAGQHDNIEELIARETPILIVLRLLCLESCIAGGLKPKDLENFKRAILHAYGFQHLLTLDALDKLQLLQSRASVASSLIPSAVGGSTPSTKTNYAYLRRSLRLIMDEVKEEDPSDIAYVYSGYAPLSIRLVQCVLQKQYLLPLIKGSNTSVANATSGASQGWRGFENDLSYVRGKTFDEVQRGEDKAVRARMILNGQSERKTVVVFFVGGITFTEIAALRFIAKQEEERRRILICTTSIISGNRIMDAAMEHRAF